jgi:hypothetical protein
VMVKLLVLDQVIDDLNEELTAAKKKNQGR